MPRKRPAPASPFPLEVGVAPYVVRVVERGDKRGMVYLQWWKSSTNNHGWQSLRFRLAGRTPEEITQLVVTAQAAAQRKYEELSGQRAPEASERRHVLTIADAWAILTHKSTGKYPKETRYRTQLAAALALGARVLGEDFPWVSLDRTALRRVVRKQADLTIQRGKAAGVAFVGFRPAQIMGTRLLTIATLLRDEGYLPDTYHPPNGKGWHADLRTYIEQETNRELPPTHRPRYSEEEIDRLHLAAPKVDPRFVLLIEIGEYLRPEQVARTWRSQIRDDFSSMIIEGRGKKRGTTMHLTEYEQAALRRAMDPADPLGYLADCEAAWRTHERDYLLFPSDLHQTNRAWDPTSAPLRARVGWARAVERQQVNRWVARAEQLAEPSIAHVKGRNWYGLRRGGTDDARDEQLGGAELQAVFGWTDPKMADMVYEDRTRTSALEGAKTFRAERAARRAARGSNQGESTDG